MSQRNLDVPGASDQHAQSQGGLQQHGHIPQENKEQERKSSLLTVKKSQRSASIVSFDENTTTIESEQTKEEKESEKCDTQNVEKNCEDEGKV